ncbi:fungal cellulose binding domain-containing protein [Rhizoctonia solani AG-1 IA]|uniref:Fungal cellulose binding domain-containing protein n=1 Tax=Thanatephorus cucumeris (strain AG1-IA) TaxID=983506 RepID=L8X772_THACA|nr:fungal cellulose binding domain-containing protein [Rhizoctonia solani AG-1 IA]
MFKSLSLGSLAVAFLASGVVAQQPEWAQCGGINWTGEWKNLRFWSELRQG